RLRLSHGLPTRSPSARARARPGQSRFLSRAALLHAEYTVARRRFYEYVPGPGGPRSPHRSSISQGRLGASGPVEIEWSAEETFSWRFGRIAARRNCSPSQARLHSALRALVAAGASIRGRAGARCKTNQQRPARQLVGRKPGPEHLVRVSARE